MSWQRFGALPLTRDELEAHYRRYINCLNARRIDEAQAFYCDELLYNGEWISRATWRKNAIEDSFVAMPDLQWHIEKLVIADDYVAARLVDTGTLTTGWRGIKPTGQPSSFGEHVFYRFKGGRTDEVWSIVDIQALGAPGGE